MNVLIDTNVLARIADPSHAQHVVANEATELLGKQGHALFLIPQVVCELWVVMTRPLAGGGFNWRLGGGSIPEEAWRGMAGRSTE